MLTLILGRAKSGKSTKILEKIIACPSQEMASRVLLVPEQLSHGAERRLGELGGDGISYYSEVLSFTRLQSRVFAQYGGGAAQVLDKGGRLLCAKLALDSIRPQLKVFAAASGKAAFLSQFVTMLDECKSYGVTEKTLFAAARAAEGQLSQKLQELGVLLGAYDAVTAQVGADPRDRLELLRQKLLTEPYAQGRFFFVDGFSDFSALEFGVLEALLRRGADMTVALACDSLQGDTRIFSAGRETAHRLVQLADRLQVPCAVEQATLPREGAIGYLEAHLFQYTAPPYGGEQGSIHLFYGASRLQECRFAAQVLKQHAVDGVRWREMFVACGDETAYGPMLSAACQEAGVPLFRSARTELAALPAAEFVLSAIEAAAGNYQQEEMLSCFKSGYAGLSDRELDELENYVYTWKIRGSKWGQVWKQHPDGFGRALDDGARETLEGLNALRERVMAPLARLRDGLRRAGTTRGQVEAVYRFLTDTELFAKIQAEIQALTEAGALQEAQAHTQLWNVLMTCLQQVCSTLGKTAQSVENFLRILRLALGQYDLGTIPASLDAVTTGGVLSVRGEAPRVLLVLGATEGAMPACAGTGSLLSEQERKFLLDALSLELAPDSEGRLERELFGLYSALSAPTDHLYLSYPAADRDGEVRPSFLWGRLRTLFPQAPVETLEPVSVGQLARAWFTSQSDPAGGLQEAVRYCADQADVLSAVIRSAQKRADHTLGPVSPEETRALFGREIALTASRLDTLSNCPFAFFLKYGLRARAREQAALDAALYGTAVHYVLERAVAAWAVDGGQAALDRAASMDMAQTYLAEFRASFGLSETPERTRYLYDRSAQEVGRVVEDVSRELSASAFRPAAFELSFGMGGDLPPVTVPGALGTGRLSGTVDRADVWTDGDGNYLRVIDYKTGSKTFDYTDLYHGVGTQMLLYLFTLAQEGIPGHGGPLQPAGVLYCPARSDILPAKAPLSPAAAEALRERSSAGRSGLVLGEDQVLSAMETDGGETYLPVKRKKEGEAFALSRAQLELLRSFVFRLLGGAVDRIIAGDFAPAPCYRGKSHDPCAYCDFGDVCQKDGQFKVEHYVPPLKPAEFWEKLEEGETDG